MAVCKKKKLELWLKFSIYYDDALRLNKTYNREPLIKYNTAFHLCIRELVLKMQTTH